MRSLVFLTLSLLASCTRPLDTPGEQVSCSTFTDATTCVAAGCQVASSCCPSTGFPGCVPKGPTPNYCSAGCGKAISCSDLTDAATCNAQAGCWALLTYDEPCNHSGCESHFSSCETGQPICDGVICDDNKDIVNCDGANTIAYEGPDFSCAIGCVDVGKCPAP